VIAGLGIETLAIALCVELGDDEEAIVRTVGVIAGTSFGACNNYTEGRSVFNGTVDDA